MGEIIIMRGLPGSGKDRYIDCLKLRDRTKQIVICSADDYFMKDGKYVFVPYDISKAHAACQSLFIRSLIDKVPTIIVNNTNCEVWEFNNYILMADMMGYSWRLVDLFDGDVPDAVLAERNKHGVSIEKITAMRDRYMFISHDYENNGLIHHRNQARAEYDGA